MAHVSRVLLHRSFFMSSTRNVGGKKQWVFYVEYMYKMFHVEYVYYYIADVSCGVMRGEKKQWVFHEVYMYKMFHADYIYCCGNG